jgi:hypothetical protein
MPGSMCGMGEKRQQNHTTSARLALTRSQEGSYIHHEQCANCLEEPGEEVSDRGN